MKASLLGLAAAAALLVSGHAAADQAMAQKDGCLACHGIDKKIVGPAYKDIAKKYAGQKDAEAHLVKKVTEGGKGVWGEVPMPPKGGNAAVSDADVKALVKWVLSLK